MYDIILSFITAFTMTYFAIPSIINIAKVKHLVDEPGERRSHTTSTPSLGGIAIFAGVLFSIIMWTPFHLFENLQYILCAFIVIFLVGAKDDIIPMSPKRKLIGQFFAACILVFKSGIQITSLHGILGIHALHPLFGVVLTIFTMLVIINAFNLIDGINGLSGGIGVLNAITLGTWFFLVDRTELSIVAFAFAGALIAFLNYNVTPARIFMGDTGSLLLGTVFSTLIIQFIEINKEITGHPYAFKAVPAVAIGLLILPLYDTFRVFTMRIIRGKSPFSPDRTHIHHLLLDFGFTHMQSTAILLSVNMGFITMVFLLQNIGVMPLLLLEFSVATLLTALLYTSVRKQKQEASENTQITT